MIKNQGKLLSKTMKWVVWHWYQHLMEFPPGSFVTTYPSISLSLSLSLSLFLTHTHTHTHTRVLEPFGILWILECLVTHSSVLAWRIPGMGEPGGLPSLGSHRIGHDWSDLAAAAAAACLVSYPIKSVLFKLCCKYESLSYQIKMQVLIQGVWGGPELLHF